MFIGSGILQKAKNWVYESQINIFTQVWHIAKQKKQLVVQLVLQT
jgi:hypothetical protein